MSLIERQLRPTGTSSDTNRREVLPSNGKTNQVEDDNEQSKSYPHHACQDKPATRQSCLCFPECFWIFVRHVCFIGLFHRYIAIPILSARRLALLFSSTSYHMIVSKALQKTLRRSCYANLHVRNPVVLMKLSWKGIFQHSVLFIRSRESIRCCMLRMECLLYRDKTLCRNYT